MFRRTWQDHDDRGFEKGQGRIKDRLGHKQVGFVDGIRGGSIHKRTRGGHVNKVLNHLGLEDLDVDLEVTTTELDIDLTVQTTELVTNLNVSSTELALNLDVIDMSTPCMPHGKYMRSHDTHNDSFIAQ